MKDLHEPLQCPICRASWKDQDVCYRCGSDLLPFRTIKKSAGRLLLQAQHLEREGRLEDALCVVDKSLSLFTCREGISCKAWLLAQRRDFERALRLLALLQ